jgi:Flp pilus assembly pilin Flp
MRSIMRLFSDDGGAAEIEYGLFAAVVAVGVVALLQLLGVLQH